MTAGEPVYGLVEAGGTKFVLGIAKGPQDILAKTRIPTTTPEETIAAMVEWFVEQTGLLGPLDSIGIASFGPIELDRTSSRWGRIGQTPKVGWSGADLIGPLAKRFGCSIAVETDVNAAAKSEMLWGSAREAKTAIYVTVGTGIGGGVIINGELLQGNRHPELGHMRIARHPMDEQFLGACPSHGSCLEGLAAGPSILQRWGKPLSELEAGHHGHDVIANYLGQMVCNLQSIFEPDTIVLGGGVMNTPGLLEAVGEQADNIGAGYFATCASEILARPGLNENSGLLGALSLAMQST